MITPIKTCALNGLDGTLVTIEATIANGMPSFDIVGLPDASVKESKERIKASFKSSNSDLYRKKIVVNLAPASLKKEGSLFDLPIALSIVGCEKEFNKQLTETSIFIGEMALTGEIRGVSGVLPIVISAFEQGIENVFLPPANAKEAAIVEGINIYPVKHYTDAVRHLCGEEKIEPYISSESTHDSPENLYNIDFADVKGQEDTKRALLVAAAGNHNMIMIGAPGSGKTMIAKRIPTILPPLSFEESLEVTKIYSVAEALSDENPLITERPFRQIHHTVSTVSITGGGKNPKPGELSLSHRGILFMDELPEFRRDALETLRQPLEDGHITVTRVSGSATYPCKVMIVASMNPCPCGFYSSPVKQCTCTSTQISRYLKKISGPLLDRIDIHVDVPSVEYDDLSKSKSKTTSAVLKAQVLKAREIQKKRYKDYGFLTNSEIPSSLIDLFCELGEEEKALMKSAYESLGLSARANSRILKVARTIADLDESENIKCEHLAEAIQYRSLDKKYWN